MYKIIQTLLPQFKGKNIVRRNNLQFMKVDGIEALPDCLENAKFTSMAWTHDNKGLFYNVSLQSDVQFTRYVSVLYLLGIISGYKVYKCMRYDTV